MSHIHGQHDTDLHDDNGDHRGCPSTDGHQLELWEARLRRHYEAHRAERAREQATHDAEHTDEYRPARPRSLAGPSVDASWLREIIAAGEANYGDRFDGSDLAAAAICAPYLHNGLRLKVRNGEYVRTGTVGKTTGWRPAFLLMHRSSDVSSGDVLGPNDHIIATWNGRRYEPVPT